MREPTLKTCRVCARAFIKERVKTGRQWDDNTLEAYMPTDYRLDYSATFSDLVTIETISRFMWRNAVLDERSPNWALKQEQGK